jgi:hypothetical protein
MTRLWWGLKNIGSGASRKEKIEKGREEGWRCQLASAKAQDHSGDSLTLSRGAEALLPPHECGGSHRGHRVCAVLGQIEKAASFLAAF